MYKQFFFYTYLKNKNIKKNFKTEHNFIYIKKLNERKKILRNNKKPRIRVYNFFLAY